MSTSPIARPDRIPRAAPEPGRYPPAALIVAHPGHELRVHRWLELYRPQTFALTDGSGHGDRGRLDASRGVLERCGASPGKVFGRWSDRDAYRVIVEHRLEEVQHLILDLADELEDVRVELVASDAVEGFNPTHDLCFVIAESAVAVASRRLGREVRHFDFPLEAAPDTIRVSSLGAERPLRLELDPQAWERKMSSARAYAALRDEIDRALGSHTSGAFRVEVLSPVAQGCDVEALALGDGEVPFYETYGERRVADGIYGDVLRFRRHWLPLALAIRRWAAKA